MIIDFTKMNEQLTQGFKGGEKFYARKAFEDQNNKIMLGRLVPGASIGLHTHEGDSEVIFFLQGRGKILYDGGYDLKNNLDGVITEFDNIIGLNRLRAVHLNDSKFGLGSHKDRHAKIGEGELGLDAIVRIINHPALRNLPFYLETPNDLEGYKAEIRLLKDLYRD